MATLFCDPRSGIYYFRRAVPEALRPLLGGKREYKVSLRTNDIDVAKARQPAHAIDCERQLALARKRLAAARLGQACEIVDRYVATLEPDALQAEAMFIAIMELLSHSLHLGLPVPEAMAPIVSEFDFGEPPSLADFRAHQTRARLLIVGGPNSDRPLAETVQRLRNSRNYQPLKKMIELVAAYAGLEAVYGSEMFNALAEAYADRILAPRIYGGTVSTPKPQYRGTHVATGRSFVTDDIYVAVKRLAQLEAEHHAEPALQP
jgi:hypothetical protein